MERGTNSTLRFKVELQRFMVSKQGSSAYALPMSDPQPQDDSALRFDKTYRDSNGEFRVTMDEDAMIVMGFDGRGSIQGTWALVGILDEVTALLDAHEKVRCVVDLRGLSSTPLRAQLILGKWLFQHRGNVKAIAIYGARPWEKKLAKAVMKIARLKQVAFLDHEKAARDWIATAGD